MASDGYESKRVFTVDEVNAMLPLVKSIARDLAGVSREVIERRERLALLQRRDRRKSPESFAEEVAQIEAEYEAVCQRWQELIDELTELGAEPKNGLEGLIDFPARMDDRIVYLCWKLGEPELLYWHEVDAGFAGRQPLSAETITDLG